MKIKSLALLLLSAALLPLAANARPEDGKPGGKGNRPSPEEIFQKLDADQNGSISQDEAKGPMAKHFDRIDADGNGSISKDEHAEVAKKMRERNKKAKQKRGEKWQEMDADDNGSISKSEAGERLSERFDEIDSNGDGEVTKEELKAAAKDKRSKKGKPQDEA